MALLDTTRAAAGSTALLATNLTAAASGLTVGTWRPVLSATSDVAADLLPVVSVIWIVAQTVALAARTRRKRRDRCD